MASKDDILNRADELLATLKGGTIGDSSIVIEVYQGTLTLLRVVHGPASIQEL